MLRPRVDEIEAFCPGGVFETGAGQASERSEEARAFGSFSDGGMALSVYYAVDHNGEQPERCEVNETEDSVEVTVIITVPAAGTQTRKDGYRPQSAELALEEPLNNRAVIDGSCGQPRPSIEQLRHQSRLRTRRQWPSDTRLSPSEPKN